MIFRLNILLSGYYVKLEMGNPSWRLGFLVLLWVSADCKFALSGYTNIFPSSFDNEKMHLIFQKIV